MVSDDFTELFYGKGIKNGECFTEENVRLVRPDYGLNPK